MNGTREGPGSLPEARADAKTGPRHVLLGEAARELLDCLAEMAYRAGVSGLQGRRTVGPNDLWGFWVKARDAAGIVADDRLQGLRHAHAAMNGENLHVAGRRLGQVHIQWMLRCTLSTRGRLSR